METSTIAAIASGKGGGVGIIRVSGPRAAEIGRQVLKPWPAEPTSHQLYLGTVHEAQSALPIDQVIFCVMRAPRSYTGEDVLEIHGHGGALNLGRIVQSVIQAGAAPAGPGEFTRRAFLNGKLDLTQAEAIAALINAQSISAAQHAQRQLAGELGQEIAALKGQVESLLGSLEAGLDFPDAVADQKINQDVNHRLPRVGAALRQLADSFRRSGRALTGGLEVAFVGLTNVGKSSLINALCGVERVIVSATPGTTRDFVEVHTEWDGLSVTLIDTAGEGDRGDVGDIERQGRRLARARWRQVDLLVVVLDASSDPVEERLGRSFGLQESGDIPRILVWNKIDQHGARQPPGPEFVACSALCGWGLSEVRARILEELAPSRGGEGTTVLSQRQATLLGEAALAVERAGAALAGEGHWDVVAAELQQARNRLMEVRGEALGSTSLLDSIFDQFCIGK